MDEERRLDSSPSSTCTSRSVLSRSNSTRYLTADEGNSDSDTFYDLDSPSVPDRLPATESTPLIIHSGRFKPANDNKPSTNLLAINIKETAKKIKPIFLFLWCIVFAAFFVRSQENQHAEKLVCVSSDLEQEFAIPAESKIVRITIKGPFLDEDYDNSSNFLWIGLAAGQPSGIMSSNKGNKLAVNIHSSHGESDYNESLISKTMSFVPKTEFTSHSQNASSDMSIKLKLFSGEENYSLALAVTYSSETVSENTQIVLAFIILVSVYILIIFELVHRATAAMFGALAALSVLSYLDRRPTLETVIMWIEWETLSLLFGMMILVAIFAQTGFFDYIALKAYKISKGHVWGLVTLLCIITGVVSAFLDNVTTILLLTPVTIRLCQVLNLDPTNVLIAEVIFSNIGGTATAIGDPPNVLIAAHKDIISLGIKFSDFFKHLLPGIVFCFLIGYAGLRLLYLRIRLENPDSPEISEMKREVEIWRRTADRINHFSAEEKTVKLLLLQKILRLETNIRNMERCQTREQAFKQNLKELENKYKITDFPLLVKSGFVIIVVVALFFIQSFTYKPQFAIGWIALIGAIGLILLAQIENMEELMDKVEWTTLVFFAGLFVLMEGLKELGLFDFLSRATCTAIKGVPESSRLAVAIIAIIWISAIVSSFVDNIPFTTAMIPITIKLSSSETSGLPLSPLVWALSMGACLGGNGTLIGASANVVCAGLSEQYGYPISFMRFTKIGFPMMLLTVTVAMGYLLVCHVELEWDNI